MKNKKVAILFYGLTRTLEKTIDSIKKNIFEPLSENSIDYDIFIHTYKIYGRYYNIYTHENTNDYNNEDVIKLLNPKYFIFDNQETIINSINFNDYYKKLGDWTGMTPELTKYLIRNMCLALYSKKQITLLFDQYINEYDYAILIRPDSLFYNKIDINYFNELNNNNIIVPESDWFTGCNDRFSIGLPNVISYQGKLFDDLKKYSEEKSITSERYLFDKLNEKEIFIIKKNINFGLYRI
jgi:hypothetical protein